MTDDTAPAARATAATPARLPLHAPLADDRTSALREKAAPS